MCKSQFEKVVTTFCQDCYPNIPGILQYLEGTDFYDAPASSHYHGNFAGGLCKHSLCVFRRLVYAVGSVYKNKPCSEQILKDKQVHKYELPEEWKSLEDEVNFVETRTPYSMGQLAFVALFHDLCKVGCYEVSTKNQKNAETGQWETVPYYKWNEQIVMGHASKSLWMLQCMTSVPLMEAQAIRYHMGFCEAPGCSTVFNQVSQVFDSNELALLLHVADLEATYLDKI